MRKRLIILLICGLTGIFALHGGAQQVSSQQVSSQEGTSTGQVLPAAQQAQDGSQVQGQLPDDEAPAAASATKTGRTHQALKQKFLEGGAGWMAPILLCLILGLAIVIERILYLNMATVNTKKLMAKVEVALDEHDIEGAKEVCRGTRGPVASICYQGLARYGEGMDVVEKSMVSYGSVQIGQMESGLTWISLFISLSPMLGFLGTVVGMVEAFDSIQATGDNSPGVVAGGIKVALLTTLLGLIAAIILQVFYNYIVSKIDSLTISMEDNSITLVDMLTKYGRSKR